MTPDIAIVLSIIAIASVLFMLDVYSPDIVALGILLALLFLGVLTPEEAFRGFGSDTVILFLGLLVGTAALIETGIVDSIGTYLSKYFSTKPNLLLLLIMTSVAFLSSFMSNTATAALFLPIVLGVTKKAGLSPSKYLLPMAFCSILTSSVTLISTSTNIVASGLMTNYQMPAMSMFELAPVGIPISIVGLLYMWFVAPRLIPDRSHEVAATEDFGLRPYLSDLVVLHNSPLVGKTLDQSGLWNGSEVSVLRIVRKGKFVLPRNYTRLEEDDVLLVEAETDQLLRIKDKVGVDIHADAKLRDPDIDPADLRIVEALIGNDSPLVGRTLKSVHFRDQFGSQVLALTRAGEQIRSKLSEIKLKRSDILLIQGSAENLKMLEQSATMRILGAISSDRIKVEKAWIVVSLFVGAIIATGFGILKVPVAFLAAATGMFITRCIEPRDAYRNINWTLIILVGSILSLGLAMEKSGAAKYLADLLTSQLGTVTPQTLLAAFFILTVVLTQIMSNQAAAIVLLPIAIQSAITAGFNPRAFAMMVAIGSSCSYLTPLEPACLMVYGPGGYRFSDFPKVGLGLTVIIMAISVTLVPIVWP